MKTRILAVAFALAACGRTQSPAVVIEGVNVLDVVGGSLRPNQTVVIRADRIDTVAGAPFQAPSGARVIDGRGKYLIPGLWDMHVHVVQTGEASLGVLLANGVTGVRDMGGDLSVVNGWRERIASGALLGPRIVASGVKLDGPKAKADVDRWVIETPEQGVAAVDSLVKLKVDFIKIYEGVPAPAFYAIARTARAKGLSMAGHVPGEVGAIAASDSGLRSVEHITFIPSACLAMFDPAAIAAKVPIPPLCKGVGIDSLFHHLMERGTWIDPTLVSYEGFVAAADSAARDPSNLRYISPHTLDLWRQDLSGFPKWPPATWRDLLSHAIRLTGVIDDVGTGVLVGSDLGNPYVYPGSSLHRELALLVQAGFPPAEALRAATYGAARFRAATDSLGSVAPRQLADLVLLDADPLADITNTSRIHAVIARGRVLERPTLDSLLAAGRAR